MPKKAAPPPPAHPPRVGPSKEVVRLSEDLERLLKQDQLKAKVPAGMDKCPVCGAAVAPARIARVRTHDDPLTGLRCEGSQRPWAEFPGSKRVVPGKAGTAKPGKAKARQAKGGKRKAPVGVAGKAQQQRRLRVRPRRRTRGDASGKTGKPGKVA